MNEPTHTLTKDCWCKPEVEVVPGPDPEMFDVVRDAVGEPRYVPPARPGDQLGLPVGKPVVDATSKPGGDTRRATAIRFKPWIHHLLGLEAAVQERSINWLVNDIVGKWVLDRMPDPVLDGDEVSLGDGHR